MQGGATEVFDTGLEKSPLDFLAGGYLGDLEQSSSWETGADTGILRVLCFSCQTGNPQGVLCCSHQIGLLQGYCDASIKLGVSQGIVS